MQKEEKPPTTETENVNRITPDVVTSKGSETGPADKETNTLGDE